MSELYSVDMGVVLDSPAIATGHVAPRMAWIDGPNGRRPGTDPERDEQGRAIYVVDVLLPLGRDGQSVVLGVTLAASQPPTPAALSPVTFEGLRAYIRPPRAGRGVEVSLSATSMSGQTPTTAAVNRRAAASSAAAGDGDQ